MDMFGKKDDGGKKDPPLKKVLGSKGEGGWIGKALKKRKENKRKNQN